MPYYKKCQSEVSNMAISLIAKYETHQTLSDYHVVFDFLFAYARKDPITGEPLECAIKHNGRSALGLCKKTSLKDRVKGNGDVEILLDGDWWETADEDQRLALLDHELHHAVACGDKDDHGRPVIKMREHDLEFGWFTTIAARHGSSSQEMKQAAAIMELHGQLYWPGIDTTHWKKIVAAPIAPMVAVSNLSVLTNKTNDQL